VHKNYMTCRHCGKYIKGAPLGRVTQKVIEFFLFCKLGSGLPIKLGMSGKKW
jgi:hypothetical protein